MPSISGYSASINHYFKLPLVYLFRQVVRERLGTYQHFASMVFQRLVRLILFTIHKKLLCVQLNICTFHSYERSFVENFTIKRISFDEKINYKPLIMVPNFPFSYCPYKTHVRVGTNRYKTIYVAGKFRRSK